MVFWYHNMLRADGSRNLCIGKPTWCAIYREYISSNTSTGFGRIHRPSSGGTPHVYNNWSVVLRALEPTQDNRQPSKKNNKYQLLYT